MNRYVDALIREMELVAPSLKPRTIFFGGGTPSLLSTAQWRRLLEAMERLDLLGADEWTVECNPATVSAEKAREPSRPCSSPSFHRKTRLLFRGFRARSRSSSTRIATEAPSSEAPGLEGAES